MGAFNIIFVLTSAFSVTYCYQIAFTLDVPIFFDKFANIANRALEITPRAMSDIGTDLIAPTSVSGKFTKVSFDLLSYIATLLSTFSRRMNEMRPNVEMGPGAFKTEILKYPENYFVNRLKTLLKIKQKEEEKNKPLNRKK